MLVQTFSRTILCAYDAFCCVEGRRRHRPIALPLNAPLNRCLNLRLRACSQLSASHLPIHTLSWYALTIHKRQCAKDYLYIGLQRTSKRRRVQFISGIMLLVTYFSAPYSRLATRQADMCTALLLSTRRVNYAYTVRSTARGKTKQNAWPAQTGERDYLL